MVGSASPFVAGGHGVADEHAAAQTSASAMTLEYLPTSRIAWFMSFPTTIITIPAIAAAPPTPSRMNPST